MSNMLSRGFKIVAAFVLIILLFTSVFCKPERKPESVLMYDFNIDSLITSIKSDTAVKADDAAFDKRDSLLIVYLVPDIKYRDSGMLRSHFKSLHITNAIKRAKNISGLVFVKTPPADSINSKTYQYQVLAPFFKKGTRFAERK